MVVPNPWNSQAWDRYAYSYNNSIIYIDPSGHMPTDASGRASSSGSSGSYGLDKIFDDETKEDPPLPDAPPDFKHPAPNGHPQPPHIPGLPDDEWEWNDEWPGQGPGYRNRQDPSGTVWRPDEGYTNTPGNEGEQPHWDGTLPDGTKVKYPDNYKWGRPEQRKSPGPFDPNTGKYTEFFYPDLSPIDIPIMEMEPTDPRYIVPDFLVLLIFIPIFALGL